MGEGDKSVYQCSKATASQTGIDKTISNSPQLILHAGPMQQKL